MTIAGVTVWLAFAAGALAFLSPCVLPLVPAYLAFLGGDAGPPAVTTPPGTVATATGPGRAQLLINGAAFVAGLSLVFILLFYALGELPAGFRSGLAPVGGILVIVLALQTAGLIRIPFLMGEYRFLGRFSGVHGPIGGFLLGLCFAFGWTPCIGPTLGAVLTSSLTQGTTAAGLGLMIAYCLGMGLPFLTLAFAFGEATRVVRALGRYQRTIQLASAAVLLAMGLLLLTNNLVWLNQVFAKLLPNWLQLPGL